MIQLSDSQLNLVMNLTRPLRPEQRNEFLQRLAAELEGKADIGDGMLFRIARDVIKTNQLFDAPLSTTEPHVSERGHGRRKEA